MSTTTAAVERYQPSLTETEQMTLLGFLAGYRGYTRDAYTLDLRQYTAWCWQHTITACSICGAFTRRGGRAADPVVSAPNGTTERPLRMTARTRSRPHRTAWTCGETTRGPGRSVGGPTGWGKLAALWSGRRRLATEVLAQVHPATAVA